MPRSGTEINNSKLKEILRPLAFFAIGAAIGAFIYLMIYDKYFLSVRNTRWIWQIGEDMIQHQLGFMFFKNAPWDFPFGCYRTYPYPALNSIVYTDSLPLLALLCKLMRGILPDSFQYFGLWMLFSFMMQGALSMAICRKLGFRLSLAALSAPLFICNMVFIHKAFHQCAISSQWIILLAFLLWLYHDDIHSARLRCMLWTLLCCLSVSVHFYFLPMVGFIMLSDCIYGYLSDRNMVRCISRLFISAACTCLVWYLLGGFSTGDPSIGKWGRYVVNLLAFFNPKEYSNFFPEIKTASGLKAERAYLGAAFILLLLISMIYSFYKRIKNKKGGQQDKASEEDNAAGIIKKNRLKAAIVPAVLLTLWAVGPVLSAGSHILVDLRPLIPEPVLRTLAIIRTSSRMIWPVYYAVLFLIAYYFKMVFKEKTAMALVLMGGAAVMQYAEIIPNHTVYSREFPSGPHYESEFYDGLEQKIGGKKAHMAYMCPGASRYKEPAIYAAEHHMTMNNGYFARNIENPDYENTVEDLRLGKLRADTLYCIPDKEEVIDKYEVNLPEDWIMEKIGGYYVIYTP